jgi:caa(3)-type oxidase subunit IV
MSSGFFCFPCCTWSTVTDDSRTDRFAKNLHSGLRGAARPAPRDARARLIDLGPLNIVVVLAIATAKALLIALYFMHLRYGDRLMWVVAAGSAFWLGILLTLTISDYLTRGWIPIPGK